MRIPTDPKSNALSLELRRRLGKIILCKDKRSNRFIDKTLTGFPLFLIFSSRYEGSNSNYHHNPAQRRTDGSV
jgi:hypothetical protein